jgi:hypothetical protein
MMPKPAVMLSPNAITTLMSYGGVGGECHNNTNTKFAVGVRTEGRRSWTTVALCGGNFGQLHHN